MFAIDLSETVWECHGFQRFIASNEGELFELWGSAEAIEDPMPIYVPFAGIDSEQRYLLLDDDRIVPFEEADHSRIVEVRRHEHTYDEFT